MASKKLTINKIMKNIPDAGTTEVKLDGEYFSGVTLEVKKMLTLPESAAFVRDVYGTCVDEAEGTYMPEAFEFAVRLFTLIHYAGVEAPKDAGKAYSALFFTDLYDRIREAIDDDQHIDLIDAARERIYVWRGMAQAAAAKQIQELIGKMNSMMEESRSVVDQLGGGEIQEAIGRLQALNLNAAAPGEN